MLKSKNYITVLTDYGRIPLFFHAKPFLDDEKKRFYFTNSLKKVLYKDKNQYLILIRNPKFISQNKTDEIFKILKNKYKKIFYFDDDASPRISRVDILRHVDKYYKSKLYNNLDHYLSRYQSTPTYVQYYAKLLGHDISADEESKRIEPKELSKLKLSWNLGIGYYPMYTWLFRLASIIAYSLSPKIANSILRNIYKFVDYKKLKKSPELVNAQFSTYVNNKLYSYQRDKILNEEKKHGFFTKKQNNKDYNVTLAKSSFVLSPFGYGEICFRDFEAILTYNILIKPEMKHLSTFPNIFKENSTYIPVDWDLNDYNEKIKEISYHHSFKSFIKNYAYFNYELEKRKIDSLVEKVIKLMK